MDTPHNPSVFISYSHHDNWVARHTQKALEDAGLTVWRDERRSEVKSEWSRDVAAGLARSDVVMLLWTDGSSKSHWVRSELIAARALEKGILFCTIEQAGVPRPEPPPVSELRPVRPLVLRYSKLAEDFPAVITALRTGAGVTDNWNFEPRPEICRIPFQPHNPFVGRRAELLELFLRLLIIPKELNSRALLGLSGPAGIGKTRLCIEFARRFSALYPDGIYWLNAHEDRAAWLAALVDELGLDPRQLTAEIRHHFQTHPRALLIVENVDHPDVLRKADAAGFQPADLNCSLLFTTAQTETLMPLELVRIEALSETESARLLPDTAGPELGARLGHSPLALHLATAWLAQSRNPAPATDYLAQLTTGELPELIRIQSAAVTLGNARALLRVGGQLEPGRIIPAARLRLLAGLDEPFAAALDELLRLRLIESPGPDAVRLHPAVGAAMRGTIPEERAASFRDECARHVNTAYRDPLTLNQEHTERGIDSVIADIRQAANWGFPESAVRRELIQLLQCLTAERAHLLQGGTDALPPSLYQQLLYRTHRLSITPLFTALHQALHAEHIPFLLPRGWTQTRLPELPGAPTGHTAWVRSIRISPDGTLALTASSQWDIILWRVATGEIIRTLVGHEAWVRAVVFSPDGKRAASGGDDLKVMVWDIPRGTVRHTLRVHGGSVRAVAFSPDGLLLASGSDDHTIWLWDAASGQKLGALGSHDRPVWAIRFSPDGKSILSGSFDRSVRLWSVPERRLIRTMEGHNGPVTAVAFSADGKRALSGADDRQVIIWDLETGRQLHAARDHTDAVTAVEFAADNRYALTSSLDGSVVVRDLAEFRSQIRLVLSSAILSMSNVGPTILVGDQEGQVNFLSLEGMG